MATTALAVQLQLQKRLKDLLTGWHCTGFVTRRVTIYSHTCTEHKARDYYHLVAYSMAKNSEPMVRSAFRVMVESFELLLVPGILRHAALVEVLAVDSPRDEGGVDLEPARPFDVVLEGVAHGNDGGLGHAREEALLRPVVNNGGGLAQQVNLRKRNAQLLVPTTPGETKTVSCRVLEY